MKEIIKDAIAAGFGYDEYRKTISKLLGEGKATGNEQSEKLVHFTLLNETRMNRLEKTVEIPENIAKQISGLRKHYTWLVISEGWCGDSAQLVPVIGKLAAISEMITMKVVFRDENEALMDLFLTNGSRSIPKLIVLDDALAVKGEWGPRPQGATDLIKRHKASKGVIDDEAKTELQMWYLHDKGISTQTEIAALMSELEKD